MRKPTSRRTLLRGMGLALAASAGRSLRAEGTEPLGKLPPAVARLPSMRGLAHPITVEERRARIARAQELMAQSRIDAILLAGGTSLAYFTGVRWGNSERLFAAVLPARGKAFCVCPAFEEERAREQLNRGPLEDSQVRTWQEDESPYKQVAAGLQGNGSATGTLGIEERTPWVFSEGIARAAPGLHLVSATPVTAGCRMIKSAHELELMQLANRATLAVYQAVYQSLQPGMTKADGSRLIDLGYARVGFRGEASVQVGPGTALPHGSEKLEPIRENTVIMIDDGCLVEGYNSDITRTFVLGKASDKMKRVFEVVKRAQSTALAAARPGVPCEAVDAAARRVISEAGFGPDYRYFSHRVGHGIGLDGHEWPYLVRGNALPLAANMTFSDEPGVYLRGEFGIRLEDDMRITPDGARLFTPQSESLENPFG